MPRPLRIDFPSALHYVQARALHGQALFQDDMDRERLCNKMQILFRESRVECYAWALLSKQIHLVLRTGDRPMSRTLQSLFTGYSLYFNRRWKRSGHLFEGRFQSNLFEERLLLELVKKTHLAPLREKIVLSKEELDIFPWSGHVALLGKKHVPWQNISDVLRPFENHSEQAQRAYCEFLHNDRGTQANFSPEQSTGIFGSPEFIQHALSFTQIKEDPVLKLRREGWNEEKILSRAAQVARISLEELRGPGKRPAQCLARSLACKWLVDDLALPEKQVAQLLQIAMPTVSENARRGRRLAGLHPLSMVNP